MQIVIVFVLLAAASNAEREIVKPPPEVMKKIYKIATPCAAENNVDAAMIPKLPDGTLPRDDATNKFLFCFLKGVGYVNDKGHIEVEKAALLLKNHPLQPQFKEALIKCNDITKESPMATVIAMNDCFAATMPVKVVI